jgi:hypothetical protein
MQGWQSFTNPSFESQGECTDYYNDFLERRLEEISERN